MQKIISLGVCFSFLLANLLQAEDAPAVFVLKKHGDHSICFAALSPDGKKIVTGDAWNEVRIWDADTGKELHRFQGAPSQIASSLFSPDGKRMVICSGTPNALIIDVDSGKELKQLQQSRRSDVEFIAFSPDGKKILTTGKRENYAIRIWSAESDSADYGKELQKLEGQQKVVAGYSGYFTAAFFPDAKKIVAKNSKENTVQIWDIDPASANVGKELHKLKVDGRLYAANLSPDGKKIVIEEVQTSPAGHDFIVGKIWDIDTGKELRKWEYQQFGAFSPDGKKMIIIDSIKWDKGPDGDIETVQDFDGNRKTMQSGRVRILDTESGEELHQLKMKVQVDTVSLSPIHAVAFFPDGKNCPFQEFS